MKLYLAPLEGITTYTYRNTHAEMFGGADAYFAPFINPSDQEKVSQKGMRDILPEKNKVADLKVQVLTSNAESFLKFCDKIKPLGYDEVNINIGCPASTVVRKGRGAGFLCNPEAMDEFFREIFSKSDMKISVKTRVGFSSHSEMERIMEVYNKYPISLLAIHPRTREEFYNGSPGINTFAKAYDISNNKLCYNGDVFTTDDFRRITERFENLDSVMVGRGVIQNPALFREIRGGKPLETEELIAFSKKLIERYRDVLGSDVFTLHKLKEIWVYILKNFPDEKKIAKTVKKSGTVAEFMSAISKLPKLW